jgi:hypothetical protein
MSAKSDLLRDIEKYCKFCVEEVNNIRSAAPSRHLLFLCNMPVVSAVPASLYMSIKTQD